MDLLHLPFWEDLPSIEHPSEFVHQRFLRLIQESVDAWTHEELSTVQTLEEMVEIVDKVNSHVLFYMCELFLHPN